jgi:hypothetical protein
VNRRVLIPIGVALLAATGVTSCGDSGSSGDRGSSAVGLCRGHGGVVAIEDEIGICRDQTVQDAEGGSQSGERGSTAVALCREHGGVSAFDDDIVICQDQTVQEAEE